MTLDPLTLFCMLFFSMVGMGYCAYGKKESIYFRLAGIALLVYPYFVDNIWVIGGLGTLFTVLPFVFDYFFPL